MTIVGGGSLGEASLTRGWARLSLAAVVSLALTSSACMLFDGKKKKVAADEDNAKAFAELEKNDKDDSSAKPPAPTDGPERPKGPVFPAPFTAEQIRDATKNGRTYRYKVEVPNKPTKEYTITFRNVDEGGAEISNGSDSSKRMAWLTLQQHSEFPKDKVTKRDEKLKTPAGKFECVVYVVEGENEEIWTYYFAKKLPGAPVFFYVERHGKRLRTTTLIEHLAGK